MTTKSTIRKLSDGEMILFEGREWKKATAYEVDDVIVPTQYNGYAYHCTRAGTSGSTEPTWPTTIDGSLDDPDANGAEWTCKALNKQEMPYIEDGGFKASNPINLIEYKDRGVIKSRRYGDQEHCDLEWEVKLMYYHSEAGDTPSLADMLYGEGAASGWASARPDAEPHAVNVLFRILHSRDSKYECFQYPGFTPTERPLPTEGTEANTQKAAGKAFCEKPTTWHVATS